MKVINLLKDIDFMLEIRSLELMQDNLDFNSTVNAIISY